MVAGEVGRRVGWLVGGMMGLWRRPSWNIPYVTMVSYLPKILLSLSLSRRERVERVTTTTFTISKPNAVR